MKLLVCISKTPDTTSKIRFNDTGKKFIEDGIQFILNPYDEWYSLVKALELKEKNGGQVDVIHVGNATSEILIRKALAIGADSAFRIDDEPEDSTNVAFQIAEFAKSNSYDIIFTGKETIDHNNSEVGAKIAEYLNLPFISYCNQLDFVNDTLTCSTEVEGGNEIIEVILPVVISSTKGLAEQRIPNMKGIIDAKKKPLNVINKIPVEHKVELIRFESPAPKTGVKMISPDHLEELIDVFRNELKII